MGDLGYNTAPANLNGTGLLATKGNVTYLRRIAIQPLHRVIQQCEGLPIRAGLVDVGKTQ
jgi:hypothetical protein